MSDDLQALMQRARSGDAAAMTALGKRLLFADGVAPSPEQGIALLSEATARSNGEAASLMARIAAWGVMRPSDVERGLDLTAESAARNWAPSRAELKFLAKADGEDWFALRRRVAVADWLKFPPSRRVMDSPCAHLYERFASPAECDWIIDRLRGDLERARVYRGVAQAKIADTRTNSEAGFMLRSADLPMCLIRNRIAAALRVSPVFCEVTKLLHYLPGQTFKLHSDYMDPALPALREEIARRGQRYATFLLYLNDDYEGGETDFPYVGFRYRGSKGDALLFFNVDATGEPDPMSQHAGLPPMAGEKWLLSQWIGSRPINPFMTSGPMPPPLDGAWLRSFRD